MSRLITQLNADAPRALKAIRASRAAAREHAWQRAGDSAPGTGGGLVTVDIDATIVIAHSSAQASPTWKKTFGSTRSLSSPTTVPAGPASRWPSCSGPATPALTPPPTNHIEATRLALAQLPRHLRREVLIRADSGGGTHEFLAWLARPGRRLAYSAGFTIAAEIQDAIGKIPAATCTPAYDAEGTVRPGAWVAEITGMLDLSSWPKNMRAIVRKERPPPGVQLRFTHIDGHGSTCFATSTKGRPAR